MKRKLDKSERTAILVAVLAALVLISINVFT